MTEPEIVRIRPMTIGDVPRVVGIHQAAFSGFFLTFLGPRFLGHLYAEAVNQGEIVFVAEIAGDVLGLVMGSARPGSFYGNLLRRRLLAFGIAAAPAVLHRPSVAMRVAKALLSHKTGARPAGMATLMSIAVLPRTQGRSAGTKLVSAFAVEARRRGALVVVLNTDRDNNDAVNRFYVGAGFRLGRASITAEGRALNEYELDISGC